MATRPKPAPRQETTAKQRDTPEARQENPAKNLTQGGSFEVLTRLSYPTDPAVLERLARGDRLAGGERKTRRALPGQIVDDIPIASIPWLLEQGYIKQAERKAPQAPAPRPGAPLSPHEPLED